MSDHTTAGWQELSRALGKDAVAAILAEPPDDTFGWGATLEQMWREPAHPSGLLLLGPDGCGKHTATLHMMRILMADGYQYAVLNDEVLGMAGSVAELIDWIGAHMRRGIRALCWTSCTTGSGSGGCSPFWARSWRATAAQRADNTCCF